MGPVTQLNFSHVSSVLLNCAGILELMTESCMRKLALNAGAISVQEPIKQADEDKRGGVKDSGGTTWWIATKVE